MVLILSITLYPFLPFLPGLVAKSSRVAEAHKLADRCNQPPSPHLAHPKAKQDSSDPDEATWLPRSISVGYKPGAPCGWSYVLEETI